MSPRLALLALVPCVALAGPRDESTLNVGRRATIQLYAMDTPKLWPRIGGNLKRQLGGPEGLTQFMAKVRNDFGNELRVMDETVETKGALTIYKRLSVFSAWARGVELIWAWDENGTLTQLSALPATSEAPAPHAGKKPKTELKLPFDGVWNVLWGGRTWELNRHASVSDQRFALDLLAWGNKNTFDGDGTKNEQYYCWGRNVRAPAAGKVVRKKDGVYDNAPGQVNPNPMYGNHLVIDHGNGEYSLLAHLQFRSITVEENDTVEQGQVVGRTGNSGASTEPHLHYQLMDDADWVKANGLPARFVDYVADGKTIEAGEPVRGQRLSPLPARSSSAGTR
jgi:hypothetical protein